MRALVRHLLRAADAPVPPVPRGRRRGGGTIGPMAHPTAGEEEYLETLYWLHEVDLPLTAANVARAMLLSAPTVHEMVKRLNAWSQFLTSLFFSIS